MTTTCVSPPELDDRQLLAYLDDREANQETAVHLGRCPYCREKAEALEHVQKRLTSQLYRLNCPSPLELGEYHLHMLPSAQMLVISQHLTECPHCAREVAELEEFLGDDAPAEEDSLIIKTKAFIARLVGQGEAGLRPAFGAIRGESKGPLTFEADGLMITLDLQAGTEGRTTILGQVAADDQDQWTNAEVKIQQAGAPLATIFLDDLGTFHWDEARAGSIQITITSRGGIEVQIPNIDV